MNDNIIGILNQINTSYVNYESNIKRKDMAPHERMLDILEEDYCRFYNHDEWLDALKDFVSVDEAELWCALPVYTRHEEGASLEEIKDELPEAIRENAINLATSLVEKGLVFENNGRYVSAYLLNVLGDGILDYHGTPLDKACLNWWRKTVYNSSESRKFRIPRSVFRVIPHESTLTGDSKYGKIPMNLEIPDTRTIVDDFDRLSNVLKKVRRFAVVDCICRTANDVAGDRKCDQPLEVCLLFNEEADGGIEMGAREITYEEALDIVKMCRDNGLVQAMSNDEYPLALCNCCECCCLYMNNRFRGENLCDVSRFIVDIAHQENCIQCGICMSKCPAKVLDVHENYIGRDIARCIGCGVCVSKCPKGVLSMSPKPGKGDETFAPELGRTYL